MDLLELIRSEVGALPSGAHMQGLQAVLHHIETAYKHLARGQSDADESAFTDSIYRTNQAFEGSAKEAYRVLAGKDPEKLRPFDVEQYLSENKVFRDRVLTQFTNYRTAWRNPSTHDYTLNFDEAEAFLAIVSVSAFVKLLVDEIAEKLSYVATKIDIAAQGAAPSRQSTSEPIFDLVTNALKEFVEHHSAKKNAPIESEAQLMGALAGFFSAVFPDLETTTGRIFRTDKPYYTDVVVSKADETIIIELKRAYNQSTVNAGINQLVSYMNAAGTKESILFFYTGRSNNYTVDIYTMEQKTIRILRPH